MSFSVQNQVRWSDLDPNGHVRHSVYYDWAATCRVLFFNQYGLDTHKMAALKTGPILFREECIFRREIRMNEEITVDLELLSSRRDYSRWAIRHKLFKADGQLAATITVEGAWIDLVKRKLAIPGAEINQVFANVPLSENFTWTEAS